MRIETRVVVLSRFSRSGHCKTDRNRVSQHPESYHGIPLVQSLPHSRLCSHSTPETQPSSHRPDNLTTGSAKRHPRCTDCQITTKAHLTSSPLSRTSHFCISNIQDADLLSASLTSLPCSHRYMVSGTGLLAFTGLVASYSF